MDYEGLIWSQPHSGRTNASGEVQAKDTARSYFSKEVSLQAVSEELQPTCTNPLTFPKLPLPITFRKSKSVGLALLGKNEAS